MQKSTRVMFFDDTYLLVKRNLSRHVGQPILVPEGTFQDPNADVSFGYPSVFPNPDGGGWRCLYQGLAFNQLPDAGAHFAALVADSEDGITWRTPDLTKRVSLADRRLPNQVEPAPWDLFGEWGPSFYDAYAEDPDERIKGFVCKGAGPGLKDSWIVTSADGLTWRERRHPGALSRETRLGTNDDRVRWHPYGSDPTVSAFRNKKRHSYVLPIRPNNGDRRIALMETVDWNEFSKIELAVWPDALDPDLAELYGMPTFPYGDMFIGLLWVYRVPPEAGGYLKSIGGRIDCQLAYSYDGWHFNRSLRDTFIANSAPGEYGAGCILPTSMVATESEIRFYSCANRLEHSVWSDELGVDQGAMLMHRLRVDGFVYLQAEGGPSYLRTRSMLVEGERLSFNVQVPDGYLKVEVAEAGGPVIEGFAFDDCTPCRTDSLCWEPVWGDGRRFGDLKGKAVELRLEMENGRLYSFSGDFQKLTAKEGMRYISAGTPPDPKNW